MPGGGCVAYSAYSFAWLSADTDAHAATSTIQTVRSLRSRSIDRNHAPRPIAAKSVGSAYRTCPCAPQRAMTNAAAPVRPTVVR